MHARFLLPRLRALFTKKKRIRELGQAKITLANDSAEGETSSPDVVNYMEMRNHIDGLAWETMDFDRLCNLPANILGAIELEVKKDKFNIDDKYFQQHSLQLWGQQNEVENLNVYYQKMHALFKNDHHSYDLLDSAANTIPGYLGHMYVQDLRQDKQLEAVLTHFINNLQNPSKLENVTEPTFIKKLLTIKRQLVMQGVKFQTVAERKQEKKKLRKVQKIFPQKLQKKLDDIDLENEQNQSEFDNEELLEVKQELNMTQKMNSLMQNINSYENQLKVIETLNYEHEFWVDVKPNRAKNGTEQDYIISLRNIPNPNETLLLTSQYPTLPVKYIVRKEKHKQYSMHFCTKADLLIKINNKHTRKIKIQWNGPANKQKVEVMDYRVIDYENLMSGNPTIRSIFSF